MKIKLTNNAQTKLASVSANLPNGAWRTGNVPCVKGSRGADGEQVWMEGHWKKIKGPLLTINRK